MYDSIHMNHTFEVLLHLHTHILYCHISFFKKSIDEEINKYGTKKVHLVVRG